MTGFDEEWLKGLRTEQPQAEFYDPAWSGRGSFGVRVNRRRGSKAFFLMYSFRGRRRRFPLGVFPTISLEDARALAVKVSEKVAGGTDPVADRKRLSTDGEFRKVSERFLGRRRLKPATRKEYERILKTELLPQFSGRTLEQITERDVRLVVFHIGEERGSWALANRARALLSALFQFGLEAGLCEENPVSRVPASVREVARRTSRGTTPVAFDLLQIIYAAAQELTPPARALVQFTLLSGVPVRHVQELKWEAIRGDFWLAPDGTLVSLTPQHRALLNSVSRESDYIFTTDGERPFRNTRAVLQRVKLLLRADREIDAINWSDIVRSIRQSMLQIGIPYSEVALLFAPAKVTAAKISPPNRTLLEGASARVFFDWAAAVSGRAANMPDPSGKILRFRRLKRLK